MSSQRIPFPKKIESLRNDVQWDLERLASIYEKLELYPVTGAAVSQIEEMSPSSDPSLCSASVTIHNYGTINNPQIQQRTVGSSQETITANVSGDIQTLLDQLAQAVENMSSALPERIARQVKQDLMVFTAEATSSTPRKEWWQLSAEGLKKAAADVGEIGKPVIKLAGQIVPLLLAMHQ